MTLQRAFIYASLVLLAACQSLGLATPQSFSQRLANAYGVHTAVLQATTTSLQSKAITAQEAQQVLTLADQSRAILDTARTIFSAGDAAGANSKLALALTSLQAIQTYLNARGAP